MHPPFICLGLLATGSLGCAIVYGPYTHHNGTPSYGNSVHPALNPGAIESIVATPLESSVQPTAQSSSTTIVDASAETRETINSIAGTLEDSTAVAPSSSISTTASTSKPPPLATFIVTAANSEKPRINGAKLQIREGLNTLYFDPLPGGTYSAALLYREPSTNYLMVNDLYIVYGAGTKAIRTLKAVTPSYQNLLCKEAYAGKSLSCAGAKGFVWSQFLISNFSGGGSSAMAMGNRQDPSWRPFGYVPLDFIVGDPGPILFRPTKD